MYKYLYEKLCFHAKIYKNEKHNWNVQMNITIYEEFIKKETNWEVCENMEINIMTKHTSSLYRDITFEVYLVL